MTDADLDFYPFGSPDPVVTAPAPASCVKRGAVTHSCVPRAPRLVRFGAEPSADRDARVAHESNKRGW